MHFLFLYQIGRISSGLKLVGKDKPLPKKTCPRRTRMAEITFKGKSFEVDEDGFLLRFDDWCPEWLEYVKDSEGIAELTPDHQKILDFLQDYYKKNGIAPMVRILSKNTGYKLKEVYELFPSGPGKGACKMAGLPKPTGCV